MEGKNIKKNHNGNMHNQCLSLCWYKVLHILAGKSSLISPRRQPRSVWCIPLVEMRSLRQSILGFCWLTVGFSKPHWVFYDEDVFRIWILLAYNLYKAMDVCSVLFSELGPVQQGTNIFGSCLYKTEERKYWNLNPGVGNLLRVLYCKSIPVYYLMDL